MKAYILLAISIVWEVFATTMLKMSNGFTVLIPTIAAFAGYGLSFFLLGITIKSMPLSLAYAIWAGVGTALTALVSLVLWGEIISISKTVGIVLIIGGVIVLSAPQRDDARTDSGNEPGL